MSRKKAEMGMGTLIIFIALILVAAVAAGVLISTTNTLQNKALSVGKATSVQIGTSLHPVELYGEDAMGDNALEYFYETFRLSSGSEDMKFEDMLLTVALDDRVSDYTYNASADCTSPSNSTFGIEYRINATAGHMAGYLVKGDVVRLCFASTRQVNESEDIKTTILPRIGSPLIIKGTLPALMVDKRIPVYP